MREFRNGVGVLEGKPRSHGSLLVRLAVILLGLLVFAGIAAAETYDVSTAQELTAAVEAVNAAGGEHTISLQADIAGSIRIDNADAVVTIVGNGHTLSNPDCVVKVSKGVVNLGDGKSELVLSGDKTRTSQEEGFVCVDGDGAVCNMYDKVTVKDSVKSDVFGGGVTVKEGTFHMYGGTIRDCGVSGGSVCYGGGVAVYKGGKFVMDGGVIDGCYTDSDYINPEDAYQITSAGGGVFVCAGGSFEMNGGAIQNCRAKYGAGAALLPTEDEYQYYSRNFGYLTGAVNVNGGEITRNSAELLGGGIFCSARYYVFSHGGVSIAGADLNAEKGLYIDGSAKSVSISKNNAEYGGGLFLMGVRETENQHIRIGNAKITDNTADNGAGIGIYFRWTAAEIKDCTITENHAAKAGGGLFVYENDGDFAGTKITGDKNILCNNTADEVGADVYIYRSIAFNLPSASAMNQNFHSTGYLIDGWYDDTDPRWSESGGIFLGDTYKTTYTTAGKGIIAAYTLPDQTGTAGGNSSSGSDDKTDGSGSKSGVPAATDTVSVTVTNIWKDEDNQDGKRPDRVTVSLLKDGEKTTSKEVKPDAEGSWECVFENLPQYSGDRETVYTVTLGKVPEYETTVTEVRSDKPTTRGFLVTNTHVPETVNITVTATWDDQDDQDGKRPDYVIVNLLEDGEKISSREVRPDDEGRWVYTFEDLPKYIDGREIVYTVTEGDLPGYEYTITEIKTGEPTTREYQVTNKRVPETVSVTVTITWGDDDDKRPDTVTVHLLGDGDEVTSRVIGPDGEGRWVYTFEGLPKYIDGREIVYTVTVDGVPGYEYTITNITGGDPTKTEYEVITTRVPETVSVTVTVTWNGDNQDGGRPGTITVYLLSDGEKISTREIGPDDEGRWEYTFEDLPKYIDGREITYTITVSEVPEYETEVDGYEVINEYTPEETESEMVSRTTPGTRTNSGTESGPDYDSGSALDFKFTFTKMWQGGREDSINWTLYDHNGNVVHKKFNKKVVSDNEWNYEAWFATGEEYYIIETVPQGYNVQYKNTGTYKDVTDRCYNGGTIVNYKVPKTGDEANLILWTVMSVLGLVLLGGAVILIRKNKVRK